MAAVPSWWPHTYGTDLSRYEVHNFYAMSKDITVCFARAIEYPSTLRTRQLPMPPNSLLRMDGELGTWRDLCQVSLFKNPLFSFISVVYFE